MMKSSKQTYEDVAKACSKYTRISKKESMKNFGCSCDEPSCLNCAHFDKNEHCDLDLYDKIIDRIR